MASDPKLVLTRLEILRHKLEDEGLYTRANAVSQAIDLIAELTGSTLAAIGNLESWFEALDGYTGPDPTRWLAAQWTWNGEDSPTVESRLSDAAVVISEWRLRNVDAALIECAKPVTSIGRAA